MTTVRENIIEDIMSSLAGTTNVSSRIYRNRVVPISRGESPALIVEVVSDTPEQETSLPTLTWSLQIRISVIVRGDEPDEVADPIVESLHSKIMADLTLGGNCFDVQPGTVSFEMIDADQPAGVISCDYLVKYRTEIDDLTTSP
jgi:hypothetical protein